MVQQKVSDGVARIFQAPENGMSILENTHQKQGSFSQQTKLPIVMGVPT